MKLNFKYVLGLVTLVSIAVRAYFLLQPLEFLDRHFVPDDTYYILTIARSLAEGLGPMASDGVTTSGFQPLIVFLLVPFAWFGASGDTLLWIDLVMGAMFGAMVAPALAKIVHDELDDHAVEAAGLAGLIWALSPVTVAIDLSGMESSLALLLMLGTVLLWKRARRLEGMKPWWQMGVCIGFMLLARVDTCFVVLAIGLYEFFDGDRKAILQAALAAIVVVAPWWGYSLFAFGSPVPESGDAVKYLTMDHQAVHLETTEQIGWAVGYLIPGVLGDWVYLRDWLFRHSWAAVFGLLVVFATLFRRDGVGPMNVGGIAIVLFYIFFLPALWFYQRYLFPVYAAMLIAVAVALAPRIRVPVLAFCLALTISGLFDIEPATGLHGAKGYRQPAHEIWERLPDDATVGALQSGAIAYYAPESATVINLDGVVDSRSAEAIREGKLSDFIREEDIDYIIDWPFNINAVSRFSKNTKTVQMKTFAKASRQGRDQFLLTRVVK